MLSNALEFANRSVKKALIRNQFLIKHMPRKLKKKYKRNGWDANWRHTGKPRAAITPMEFDIRSYYKHIGTCIVHGSYGADFHDFVMSPKVIEELKKLAADMPPIELLKSADMSKCCIVIDSIGLLT